MNNKAIARQWNVLPNNREVIFSIPDNELSALTIATVYQYFLRKGITCGEFVDTGNKGDLFNKGDIILVLIVPPQNIIATKFNTKKSCKNALQNLHPEIKGEGSKSSRGFLKKNVQEKFKSARHFLTLFSSELESPFSPVNKGRCNEVIFTGVPELNTRSGFFKTVGIQVKEIICSPAVPPQLVSQIAATNPAVKIYSTNRETLSILGRKKSPARWLNEPSHRYVLSACEPIHVTDTFNAMIEWFRPFVPRQNILTLPYLDNDDIAGERYQREKERRTRNSTRMFSGLTMDDHLTYTAHANPFDVLRSIGGKVHAFHFGEQVADLLYFHGLRQVGVIYFASCCIGGSAWLIELGNELDKRGIKFGYLVGSYFRIAANRGEIVDENKAVVPYSKAFHIIKGNVRVDYTDFTYHSYC